MFLTALRWCPAILMWILALGFAIAAGLFGYGLIRRWKEYDPVSVIVFGGVTLLLVIVCWILVLIALTMGRDLL